jgi:hypothetical protein
MTGVTPQTAAGQPGRGKLLMVLIPLVLLVIGSYFFRQTDPDYWWHVRTGQVISETRALPRVDIFSYTAAGRPWITHEWLAQVGMYLAERTLGYPGNVLIFGLLGAGALGFVYGTGRLRGLGEIGAALFALAASLVGAVSANVRPQMITVFLVSLLVWLLTRARVQRSARGLWLLPLLMVAWVNLHGGYIIGLALIWLTVIGEAWDWRRGQAGALLRPLLLAAGLSTLAVLANPHGLSGVLYPLTYAGTSNASMSFIQEWQSPDFHAAIFLPLAAVLLLAAVVGLAGPPLGRVEVLWSLLFTFLALQSARHVPLYGIVVVPLLGARLATRVPVLRRPLAGWRRTTPLLALWLILPVLVATGLGLYVQGRLALQILPTPDARSYPAAGVAFLEEHLPEGNLFNEYGWGGYLIYRLFPQRPVFIDGRADVYGDDLMESYRQVAGVTSDWQAVLDRYDVQVALLRKDSPEAVLLESAPGWMQVFQGPVEVIFTRVEP